MATPVTAAWARAVVVRIRAYESLRGYATARADPATSSVSGSSASRSSPATVWTVLAPMVWTSPSRFRRWPGSWATIASGSGAESNRNSLASSPTSPSVGPPRSRAFGVSIRATRTCGGSIPPAAASSSTRR